MAALMGALSLPILILNLLGGIVGGIWLATMGRWDLVGAGIGYAIVGPFAASIALLPSFLLAGPAAWALERKNFVVGGFFGLLNLLWTFAVMLFSAVFVFYYAMNKMAYGDPIWPYLLLAYATATSPWAFLAQKDLQAGNDNAGVPVFFLQVGCIAMGLQLAFVGDASVAALNIWCGVPMLIGLLVQVFFVVALSRPRNRYL